MDTGPVSSALRQLEQFSLQPATDKSQVSDSIFGLVEKNMDDIGKQYTAIECITLSTRLNDRATAIQEAHWEDGIFSTLLDKLVHALQGHGWITSVQYSSKVRRAFAEKTHLCVENELQELAKQLQNLKSLTNETIGHLAHYNSVYSQYTEQSGDLSYRVSAPKTLFREQVWRLLEIADPTKVADILNESDRLLVDPNSPRREQIKVSGRRWEEDMSFMELVIQEFKRVGVSEMSFQNPSDYSRQLGLLPEDAFKRKLPALAKLFSEKGWKAPKKHRHEKIWNDAINKHKEGPKLESNLEAMKAALNGDTELTKSQKGQVVAFMNDLKKDKLEKWATTPENKQAFKQMISLYREEQRAGNKAALAAQKGLFDLWAREWEPKWYEQ